VSCTRSDGSLNTSTCVQLEGSELQETCNDLFAWNILVENLMHRSQRTVPDIDVSFVSGSYRNDLQAAVRSASMHQSVFQFLPLPEIIFHLCWRAYSVELWFDDPCGEGGTGSLRNLWLQMGIICWTFRPFVAFETIMNNVRINIYWGQYYKMNTDGNLGVLWLCGNKSYHGHL
jgi:hypothetical protein